MKNKKWKRFDKLTAKCYSNMIGADTDDSCWIQAFELLKEIIQEERKLKPDYAPQIELLEEETDYGYDITGWLEDCLDEIDMRENYEFLLKASEDLLNLFGWPEYTGSDLKFRKVSALLNLKREKEAVAYCNKWREKEPENIVAATASVYALTQEKEYGKVQQIINQFIPNPDECGDENDIMFTAASKFYEATGNKKAKKQIDKAMEAYDKYLETYFSEVSEEEMEEFWDEDLPF